MDNDVKLDKDIAAAVEEHATYRGIPFTRALNDLVRDGLNYVPEQGARRSRPFKTPTFALGQPLIDNLDDTEAVLEAAEGPHHR